MKAGEPASPPGDHTILSRSSLLKASCVLLVFVPLWPQLSHAESEFLGRSLIMMLAFVALAMTDAGRWRGVWKTPLAKPAAVWGLTAVGATILARYPYGAKADLAVVFMTVQVFLIVSVIDPNEVETRRIYAGLAAGAGVLAAWALWVQMQGPEDALRALRQQSMMEAEFRLELERSLKANRAMARFGNPNHLAAYLALALPACWHLLRSETQKLHRILWGSVLALLLLGIIQTRSRAGVGVTFLIAAAVLIREVPGYWRRIGERQRKILFAALAVTLIPLASAVMLKAPSLLGGRLLESKTILARLYYYNAAINLTAKHIEGVGLDGYSTNITTVMRPGDPEANEAHNLILNAAVEIGPAGVFVLLWLLLLGWRLSWRGGMSRFTPGLMLTAYVLVCLVDFESELAEFAILFGLILGLLGVRGLGEAWREPDWMRRRTAWFVSLFCAFAMVWWSLVLGPYLSRLYQEVASANRQFARDAVPALENAYNWQPRDAKLMNALGKELRFRSRTRTESLHGLELMERAVERNPDRAFLHGDLAVQYMQEKRYDEALAAVERAIERFPARLDYHVTRRECLTSMGRQDEAKAEQQRIDDIIRESEERRL